jgi:magnesium transporter
MRHPLLVPDLRELIHAGEVSSLHDFLEESHPGRVAEMIEDLDPNEGEVLFRALHPRCRAEVTSYLDAEAQTRLVSAMPSREAADLLHVMSHDERADLVNRLDEDFVDQVLPQLAQAERDDIRRLASYEAGTAGAVMTTDYVRLPPDITVREALVRVRHEAPERETIYYNYVVDDQHRLIGFVSLQKLMRSRRSDRIDEIMQRDVISARVDEDQEEAARLIDRYALFAIPVVDADDKLLGIITHDDAMDILRQEQTEDILAFGGVSKPAEPDEESYLEGSVVESVRRRIGWLLFLFLGGTITRYVIESFDWVDRRFPTIAFDSLIPLLIGTGGNAGSQTVGTIIRGLALGEIQPGDSAKVIFREMLTGFTLGLLLGGAGFLFTWKLHGDSPMFALVIAMSVMGICVWANGVGAMVPLLARRFKIDPAVVSAPLISTLVDATGLVIFYGITIILLIKLAGSG